ncbi:homeobox-leucine zipper protein REVOLUTA-like isoform X1 [Primulina eburnea]|uniref:homeobox-leucine zipper protein REVOLUTA-like isoform X1 n=1 Tax=Primulina eburnea TaxID=1245227 RepID=UPI003C6C8187
MQRVAMAISPSGLIPTVRPKLSFCSPEALTLACWICQSYRYYVGADLLREGSIHRETVLKTLWLHQDAILCCSLKQALPVFIFANQAGLDMLETTLVALQDVTLDKIFSDSSGRKALFSEFSQIMQQVV